MAKNQYLEQAFLNLIFNATPIPNIADNAASAPLTSYYISLHTADPGADRQPNDQRGILHRVRARTCCPQQQRLHCGHWLRPRLRFSCEHHFLPPGHGRVECRHLRCDRHGIHGNRTHPLLWPVEQQHHLCCAGHATAQHFHGYHRILTGR